MVPVPSGGRCRSQPAPQAVLRWYVGRWVDGDSRAERRLPRTSRIRLTDRGLDSCRLEPCLSTGPATGPRFVPVHWSSPRFVPVHWSTCLSTAIHYVPVHWSPGSRSSRACPPVLGRDGRVERRQVTQNEQDSSHWSPVFPEPCSRARLYAPRCCAELAPLGACRVVVSMPRGSHLMPSRRPVRSPDGEKIVQSYSFPEYDCITLPASRRVHRMKIVPHCLWQESNILDCERFA